MTEATLEFRIAELERKVANIDRIGRIVEVDPDKALARVRYADDAGKPAITGWRPWLTFRAHNDISWWMPEEGEQVLLHSPGGDLAQSVIQPGLYQDQFPPPDNRRGVLVLQTDIEIRGDFKITGESEFSGFAEFKGGFA